MEAFVPLAYAGLVLAAVLLGVWLRGGAADQAERRHGAERDLLELTSAALEQQVAALRAENAGLLDELRAGGAEAQQLAAKWVQGRAAVASAPAGGALDRVLQQRATRRLAAGPAAGAGAGAPAAPAGGAAVV